MSKIKIGVIFGGKSTEHSISAVSASSVIKNLNKEKYEIYPIYISLDGKWYHYTEEISEYFKIDFFPKQEYLEKISNEFEILKKQDVIFPVLHGLYGEDGTIQGMLELLNIPYVGCKVFTSSVCINKIYTKIILEKANISQAKYVVLNTNNYNDNSYIYIDESLNHICMNMDEICDIIETKLKYPIFIKPANFGSSVGVNKALNKKELEKCIKIAKRYDKELLIEQGINGREVECAILGVDEVITSCVGEIITDNSFYDYDSKYKNSNSKLIIPANINNKISEEIKRLAIRAFKAVKGTGLSRIDFFVEENTNKIYLNEINTMPGFTNISMYPKLWKESGIEYSDLLDKLIKITIENI